MPSSSTLTIADIISRTTTFFREKGIDTARLDAQLLVAHALGKSRLDLYLQFDYPLTNDELARTRELVRRRAAREPVAYILGEKEFAGRPFKVAPGVLIPRPDTEILVELVLAILTEEPPSPTDPSDKIHLLEFGIGSGAISVTLAAEMPTVRITATEVSQPSADIARENAAAHAVSDRIDIRLQPDFANITGPFHGIISNPPYIARAEQPTLAPEVADFEPEAALFADDNGLAWYHFLATEAMRLLHPGGFIAVEIGYRQAADVTRIFAEAGLVEIEVVQDYADNDRVVTARRPPDR